MWPAVIVSGEDEALMHADACPRSQQPPIPPEDFAELMAVKTLTQRSTPHTAFPWSPNQS